jgi:hypothetical protein
MEAVAKLRTLPNVASQNAFAWRILFVEWAVEEWQVGILWNIIQSILQLHWGKLLRVQ